MAVKTSRQRHASRSALVMIAMCVLGFGVCVGALVNIQLVKGTYYREKAAQNQLHDTVLAAKRGIIYDANMTPLAESADASKIWVDPSRIGENEVVRGLIVTRLSEILGVAESSVREKCSLTKYRYMVVKDKVENGEADKVRALMKESITYKNKDGNDVKVYYSYYIGIDSDVKRYYSNPFLASSVLGFTGDEDVGRAGIELKYNTTLTGVPGRIINAKNGAWNSQNMPDKYESRVDAQPGTSLVLTIDEYIQSYLEKSLEQAYINTKCDSILGIIMDTQTGAILGMGSRGKGYFDLSNPWTLINEDKRTEINAIEDKDKRREEILNEQYAQWRNIAVNDTYEPGSVFKVITAAALIEEGLVPLDEKFTCTGSVSVPSTGRTYDCHRHSGHGSQNLSDALMNSCNPFFITRGLRLGIQGFNKYVQGFGFLDRTDIDLPSEVSSIYFPIKEMIPANVASATFGQSFKVTPIQMLTAVNAIANGGKLMQPYVVAKQLDATGTVVAEMKPTVRRQVISRETSELMCQYMERVVKEGTGKNAYIAGYRVAGKTGTSEKVGATGDKTYWASFACFAPADNARVSMIVILDNPKGAHGGGAVAAPIAAEVLSSVLEYLNVEPQYTEKELEELKIEVADAVGKTVAEARRAFEGKNFSVKVKGGGDTVISQIPAGGQSVPKNGVVILYTSAESIAEKVVVPDLVGLSISEVTRRADAADINVNITCNSALGGELVSYKQSVEKDKKIASGTFVTVYFKSNMGITDFDE